MDKNALFKLSYGLFVLTAKQDGKDNGCIINTVQQVTSDPMRISVTVNKANLTHDMVLSTGEFNVSVLTEDAVFWIFQHYGFQSGRDVDKFANLPEARTANGIRFVEGCTNAVISGKVIQTWTAAHIPCSSPMSPRPRCWTTPPALPISTISITSSPSPNLPSRENGSAKFAAMSTREIHFPRTSSAPGASTA